MPDLSPGPSSQAEKVTLSFGGEEELQAHFWVPGAPRPQTWGRIRAGKVQCPLQGLPHGRHKSPVHGLVPVSVKLANRDVSRD